MGAPEGAHAALAQRGDGAAHFEDVEDQGERRLPGGDGQREVLIVVRRSSFVARPSSPVARTNLARTRHIVATTSLALVCRAAWLLWPSWDIGDSPEYLQIAAGLLTSGTFTADGTTISSYRAPLYPALLAASGFLTSDPVW